MVLKVLALRLSGLVIGPSGVLRNLERKASELVTVRGLRGVLKVLSGLVIGPSGGLKGLELKVSELLMVRGLRGESELLMVLKVWASKLPDVMVVLNMVVLRLSMLVVGELPLVMPTYTVYVTLEQVNPFQGTCINRTRGRDSAACSSGEGRGDKRDR